MLGGNVRDIWHATSLPCAFLLGLAITTPGQAAESLRAESWDTVPSPEELVEVPDDGGKYAVLTFDLLGRSWAAFEVGERRLDKQGNVVVRTIVYHSDANPIPIEGFKYSRTLPSDVYMMSTHVDCAKRVIVLQEHLDVTDRWYGRSAAWAFPRDLKPSPKSVGNTYVRIACDEQLREELGLRLQLSRDDAVKAMMDLELDADTKEEAAAVASASR